MSLPTELPPRSPLRRPLLVALAAALLVLGAIALAVRGGEEDRALVPGGGDTGERYDPLAYDPDREDELERRAAAGEGHPLYTKSPGGAPATAARVARWLPMVEATARRHRLDPAMLEAIVFLESAGRPDAIAGGDIEGAAGLTQILAETGQNLLALRVDVAASRRLTRRIARAERRGDTAAADRLRGERARVDQRFDPAKALDATGRYLVLAREKLGRDDLAVESYHMGIGNLQGALAAYRSEGDAPDEVSYTRLYFDSTPLVHARAYRRLAALGDDSATYLWRILAAREIMRLWREDPDELTRLSRLHTAKASAEEVLHPRADTEVFEEPDDIADATAGPGEVTGDLRELPADMSDLHLRVDPRMGELARRLGESPSRYRALRREALAALIYIAAGVEGISGDGPLTVTSTVRDERYQRALIERNVQATRAYSLHTTGYSFDILRRYRSRRQARAFQFMLDRLQALNLIAWVAEPDAIHVTVSSDAERLEGVLDRLP